MLLLRGWKRHHGCELALSDASAFSHASVTQDGCVLALTVMPRLDSWGVVLFFFFLRLRYVLRFRYAHRDGHGFTASFLRSSAERIFFCRRCE